MRLRTLLPAALFGVTFPAAAYAEYAHAHGHNVAWHILPMLPSWPWIEVLWTWWPRGYAATWALWATGVFMNAVLLAVAGAWLDATRARARATHAADAAEAHASRPTG
jgi:hypothetical protein